MMNTLKQYALGLGKNRAIQEAVDYGTGALAVGGLNALGNTLGDPSRADQNPLLQGLLGAPVGAAILRTGRSKAANAYISSKIGNATLDDSMSKFKALAPDQQERVREARAIDWANDLVLESQMKNPYTQAALSASSGSALGGILGRVFDNDAVGSSIGLAALGSIAPYTHRLMGSPLGKIS